MSQEPSVEGTTGCSSTFSVISQKSSEPIPAEIPTRTEETNCFLPLASALDPEPRTFPHIAELRSKKEEETGEDGLTSLFILNSRQLHRSRPRRFLLYLFPSVQA